MMSAGQLAFYVVVVLTWAGFAMAQTGPGSMWVPDATQSERITPAQLATETTGEDETPAEARRSEQALSRAEREKLQIALQWAGYYRSAIDGAFGRGTRRSMSDWQVDNGFEPTGVLTTAQRARLLGQYNAVLEGMNLSIVRDEAAGVSMKIPLGVVSFTGYDFPFAKFDGAEGSHKSVLLISQAGDQNTLFGLYEIMQTLEIVPLDGERRREASRFTLEGKDSEIVSFTEAALIDGQIKGFTLVWPRGDEERRARILQDMRASFARLNGVLNSGQSSNAEQAIDLLAGLQIRQPKSNRSGFFVDPSGIVVTTADAVSTCSRITVDEVTPARLRRVDPQLGVALLEPISELAPRGIAEFANDIPLLASEIAVSGYSYGGTLGAPTMSFGTLADIRGLNGEQNISRLSVNTRLSDAGGPVLDESGAVMGVLLPKTDTAQGLPSGVHFAAAHGAVQTLLRAEGVAFTTNENRTRIAPEDIASRARAMTVLVQCWE